MTTVRLPSVSSYHTHGSHRIDYIFQSKGATALKLTSARVFDTSDYSCRACVVTGSATCYKNSTGIDPSDHRPVMAVFEVRYERV